MCASDAKSYAGLKSRICYQLQKQSIPKENTGLFINKTTAGLESYLRTYERVKWQFIKGSDHVQNRIDTLHGSGDVCLFI